MSPHDHRACELSPEIEIEKPMTGRIYYLRAVYCYDHNLYLCYCGWEYGWHYDSDSKLLNPNL